MNKTVQKVIGIVVAVIIAGAGWQFLAKPRMARFQTWEGQLVDVYRLYDHSKTTTQAHASEEFFYNHFWKVELDDGSVCEIKMPFRQWQTGRPKERVVKRKGTPWPEMAAPAPAEGQPPAPESAPAPPGDDTEGGRST
ncbi:MAG TPA: hypothetical protein PLO37_11430 [Candidatus Hydrogenedentes bacterium]|nr:hypothetical protein [Candidatus Hydrogenedentota bacterium]HPG67451.1 hypothetical protein [Candidatus Hydrogenedentota bacterium]